jgi:putative transposase
VLGYLRLSGKRKFNSLFLWREKRTVSNYGKISMETNLYSVKGIAPKTILEIRYNPFDLSEIQIYKNGTFVCKSKANILNRQRIRNIPEESKKIVTSITSINYFTQLREQHNDQKIKELKDFKYSDLNKEEKS